jgi:two-component system response regulator
MATEQGKQVIQALVVEDNPMDVIMLRLALEQESTWPVRMTVVEDGEQAIFRLLDTNECKMDFIVLDLNLPRRDGVEVLKTIRRSPSLRRLPVAILSSSPEDVIQEKLTAAGVLADIQFTKSSHVDEFLTLGGVLRAWYEKHASTGAERFGI